MPGNLIDKQREQRFGQKVAHPGNDRKRAPGMLAAVSSPPAKCTSGSWEPWVGEAPSFAFHQSQGRPTGDGGVEDNDIFITHLHVDHFAGRVTALQACGVLNGRYDGAPSDGRAWLGGDADRAGVRVVRGGSWDGDARGLRAAYRPPLDQVDRFYNLGFRCARVQAGEGRSGAAGGEAPAQRAERASGDDRPAA